VSFVSFDEDLADRIRVLLAAEDGVAEKKMFGGLAFLIGGHMAVTASGHGGIMVRVDPAETERLLGTTNATPMVMRGRELDGWVRVGADHVRTKRQLAPWVRRGVAHARSLPPKPAARRRRG
jgi:TfoX/Sxy family transcriptional regulator of competence genes